MDKLRLTPAIVKEIRAMLKENSALKLLACSVGVALVMLAIRAPEILRAVAELVKS